MNNSDERDYAEEASNAAAMRAEGLAELEAEAAEGTFTIERSRLNGVLRYRGQRVEIGMQGNHPAVLTVHGGKDGWRSTEVRIEVWGCQVIVCEAGAVTLVDIPGSRNVPVCERHATQFGGKRMGQPTPAEDMANGTRSAANISDLAPSGPLRIAGQVETFDKAPDDGYGVFEIPDSEASKATRAAIASGELSPMSIGFKATSDEDAPNVGHGDTTTQDVAEESDTPIFATTPGHEAATANEPGA